VQIGHLKQFAKRLPKQKKPSKHAAIENIGSTNPLSALGTIKNKQMNKTVIAKFPNGVDRKSRIC